MPQDNTNADSYRGDILIVDDTPENLKFLSKTLSEQRYKVRSVTDGKMALRVANAAPVNLILLDVKMPEMDGYEVCTQLKKHDKTKHIPIIFISALDDMLDKVRAFNVGGVDYITKPFHVEEVLARIETHLSLENAKTEILKLNTELENRVRQRTHQLEKEISARQEAQERLLHLALHDSLTELPNRVLFMKQLGRILEQSQQNQDHYFSLMLLDCDHFKVVNDSLGHLVGDRLLIAVARRIQTCLPPGVMLARLGGDEFAILIEEDTPRGDRALTLADTIQQELSYPFQLGSQENFTNVSVGIVLSHPNYEQPEHLLRDADSAMYEAKAKGKASQRIFDPRMYTQAIVRLQMETDLRRAIERGEFVLYYQPIICLKTRQVAGLEALIRWEHPNRGLLLPGEFLPIAQDSDLMSRIDIWVLREACLQLKSWQDNANLSDSIFMSTNLSVHNFLQGDIIEQISDILIETGVSGHCLELEITEESIIRNPIRVNSILNQLKNRNIKFSIDDFGTGYSSLSYLHQFSVDSLKIDRSFIEGISPQGSSPSNIKIAHTIVQLAENLQLSVIAEGIETLEQLSVLEDLDCTYGQGYYFSRPLPAEAALNFLTYCQQSG
ncbi:two-component system response regulator [Sodalinema gerasimenkoae]|uniref:two-component system response regulator n=1 Tax=Sodalinema gerasimenkoae TaxID=2862348 RepID=UPI00135AD8B1|nr:EAL domain-containing response regulator [Sodalinema gerasimenkoae]